MRGHTVCSNVDLSNVSCFSFSLVSAIICARLHVAHRLGEFRSNACVLSGLMWRSWRQGGFRNKWAGIIPLWWSWRRSLTPSWWPEILQASFTVKGFSALWEAYLLASFAPLHLVFSSSNLPPHFLPLFQPPSSLPSSPHLPCPPLCLPLSFELEWTRGMRVTGTRMEGERTGKRVLEGGRRQKTGMRNYRFDPD